VRRGLDSAAFAAGSLALYATPHAPLHMDTARDLLLARDCAAGIACHFTGPPASLGDVRQGGTWIHVLEACLALHLSTPAIEIVVWGLAALAVGVFHGAASAAAGRTKAAFAALAFAAVLPWMVGHPILWNPAMLPLPAVLFFVALRASAGTAAASPAASAPGDALQGLAPVGLLALATAVLLDVHVVAVILLAVTAAAALATRSLLAGLARLAFAAAIVAAFGWLSSREALSYDARSLGRHPGAVAAGACVLAGVAVFLAARWRRGATPDAVTRDACLAYLVLVVGGGIVAGASPVARYVVPIVPGLGLLFATGMERWAAAKAIATALLVLHAVVDVVHGNLRRGKGPTAEWTVPDAEACAARLAGLGFTAHGAVHSLDAPGGRAFVSTVSSFLPLGHDGDAPAHRLVEHEGGTCADVAPPVVDASQGERCVDATCAPLRPGHIGHVPPVPDYSVLAYPERWERDPPPRGGTYDVSYRLPLVAPGPVPPLLVTGEPYATWSSTTEGATLVVTHTVHVEWDDDGWPPAVLPR
jgi:hypothetical protein